MKTTLRRSKTLLQATYGVAIASIGISGLAHAGCSVSNLAMNNPVPSGFVPAVYHPDDFGQFLRVDFGRDPAIVGLWKFEMIAEDTPTNTNPPPLPDGTLVDFGTTAWHSDGTELMNSGMRLPADGDFCQGVWVQTGPFSYSLNHIALAYSDGAYLGPAIIKERIFLNPRANQFTGTFTTVQYIATPTLGHEFDETTKAVTITGTISGTRITP